MKLVEQKHIIVSQEIKNILDELKVVPRETYEEVVKKLLIKTGEYLDLAEEHFGKPKEKNK